MSDGSLRDIGLVRFDAGSAHSAGSVHSKAILDPLGADRILGAQLNLQRISWDVGARGATRLALYSIWDFDALQERV